MSATGFFLLGSRCVGCGKEEDLKTVFSVCTSCGSNLDLVYDTSALKKQWTREKLGRDSTQDVWRWLPLLPTHSAPQRRELGVGGTPLVRDEKLAAFCQVDSLLLKCDMRLPSASLKDRASEVGIQHATESGCTTIAAASTGNAAASLATLTAWHGKKAVIFAPSSAPEAKLIQVLQHGAELFLVDGNYDAAFDLCTTVCQNTGWYSRNTGSNPVMGEGKKTVALEIAEALNWQPPEHILVPTGDGCIIGAVHKGFSDLLDLGWIDAMPRLTAVQATGSAAIVEALQQNRKVESIAAKTCADSIAVDLPRDGEKALHAVRQSHGLAVSVSDDEILEAQLYLSRHGHFVEPAAAAGLAGLLALRKKNDIRQDSRVCLLLTGHGLKDSRNAARRIVQPEPVPADWKNFETQARKCGLSWKETRS